MQARKVFNKVYGFYIRIFAHASLMCGPVKGPPISMWRRLAAGFGLEGCTEAYWAAARASTALKVPF
jgi:hypothetical protein